MKFERIRKKHKNCNVHLIKTNRQVKVVHCDWLAAVIRRVCIRPLRKHFHLEHKQCVKKMVFGRRNGPEWPPKVVLDVKTKRIMQKSYANNDGPKSCALSRSSSQTMKPIPWRRNAERMSDSKIDGRMNNWRENFRNNSKVLTVFLSSPFSPIRYKYRNQFSI